MRMKKKMEVFKTVQLLLCVAIAVLCLVVIFTNDDLYQAIGHDAGVRAMCALLWLVLVITFISIFVDFRYLGSVWRDFRELDYSVNNDHVAGIANRYSCDAAIEKYADKPLPPTVGCIMIELSNIQQINKTYGHKMGNAFIQAFADMLNAASVGVCFVGRNGGNKFMALFEDCTDEKLNAFLSRLQRRTEANNRQADQPNQKELIPRIDYRYGVAFNEGKAVTSITQLIALADRRIPNRRDLATGMPDRNSCDEMIRRYQVKALPENIGCVMLDFVNLKDINDAYGRQVGDKTLRQFSDILQEAARDLCFVGRNGGTVFLAIIDECSEEKLELFISRIRSRVVEYNIHSEAQKMHFTWGVAWHEKSATVFTDLVSAANGRIHEHTMD